MKIFVTGKGGSGKSTTSALLAKELAGRGKEVLVVDNDESNFGLHTQLGLELPKDFMYYFGGKDNLFEESEKIREGLELSDLPEEFLSKRDNLSLLAIGKISEYGEGCACAFNVLSGEFVSRLSLKEEEILIADMDAGIEHFGRKVEKGADVIIVIVDPTRESIKLSQKIAKFGKEVGKNVFFILNKVNEKTEEIMEEKLDRKKILGKIPEDERIFEAGLQGEEINIQLEEIKKIVDSLLSKINQSPSP